MNTDPPLDGRRRRMLVAGIGAAVALPELLGACSSDSSESSPPTTVAPGAPTTGGRVTEAPADDVARLRAAHGIELLLVDTYERIAGRGAPDLGAPLRDLLARFADHHLAHAEALSATLSGLDAEPADGPDADLAARLVTPGLPAARSRILVLALAHDLESETALAHASTVTALVTPALRADMLAIGGADARHVAALANLRGVLVAPAPFLTATPSGG